MLEFLLGGGVVLLGVVGGAAIVNVTNAIENRHERYDTPMEKANRLSYKRPKDVNGEPISEDEPLTASKAVTGSPTTGQHQLPLPASAGRWDARR